MLIYGDIIFAPYVNTTKFKISCPSQINPLGATSLSNDFEKVNHLMELKQSCIAYPQMKEENYSTFVQSLELHSSS